VHEHTSRRSGCPILAASYAARVGLTTAHPVLHAQKNGRPGIHPRQPQTPNEGVALATEVCFSPVGRSLIHSVIIFVIVILLSSLTLPQQTRVIAIRLTAAVLAPGSLSLNKRISDFSLIEVTSANGVYEDYRKVGSADAV
jgi:hypothetical protein